MGTPQYSNLFTGYAVRPSWQVAGVDYAAGVPSGTVLKNPASISMAGVSVNTSTHVISITGNNITLDGYDFSLNGGWQVSISGVNATVKDSYFKIGANNLQPITATGSDSLNSTLIYCEIDGSGKNPGTGTLINNINTIKYCYLHDAGQDVINYGHPLVVEYNLVANNGLIAGAHSDWIQLGSGTGWNATVDYNTFYQSGVGNMGTQGIEISGWGTDNFVGQVENNTIIVKPNGNVNNTIGVDSAHVIGPGVTVANNYIATGTAGSGSPFLIAAGNPLVAVSNNIDLNNGNSILQNNSEVPNSTPPVSTRPVSTRPVSTRPVSTRPVSTRPVSTPPVSTRPVTVTPAPTKTTTPPLSSTPTILSVVESSPSSDLTTGKTVKMVLNLSEAVTVTGNPTLTLNDGGTASYASGSGSKALTFTYTVASGQNTARLAATAASFKAGTIKGNAVNLSLTGLIQSGPQIDTKTPTVTSVTASGSSITGGSGNLTTGKTVTLTLKLSEAVIVKGSKPTLTLNDGGTATYVSGSGSNALTFSYTVAAGQKTSDLAVTAFKLNSAIVTDAAGNVANLSGAVTNPAGTLRIGTPTAPTTVIKTNGSTSLSKVGTQYYLHGSGASGPALKYNGANVTAGEFGAWTPIGAIQTASGYDVAWKNTSTGQYTVWSSDRNGNYKANLIGAVSGTSSALESLEPIFHQDLNRDGVLGPTQKLIQIDGSTRLTEIANNYYNMDGSSGPDPTLKYNGANVTTGEFGAWTPIGAIQTAGGFNVAWKNTGTGQYTVWSTDRNGNYKANLIGAVSGTSSALESLEPIFHQDLNRDGVLGPTQKLIQIDGSTRLTEIANNYYNMDGSSGPDPTLKYNGANVTTGEFGAWTPIGAIQTAGGFNVAWKNTGTGQYTVWSTDRNGNYKANLIGAVSGTSSALESLEPIFHQDLNRDGVIGLYAAPGTTRQITNVLAGTTGSATIGRGATLEVAAADSAAVRFASSTGTLRVDHSSIFTGKIFNFSGDGSFSGSDHVDLRDIKYGPIKDSYNNGTLTVTDSSGHTARLSFSGSYSLGNFKFASDGKGGTIVYDPPVSQSASKYTDGSTDLSQKAPVAADVALRVAGVDSRDTTPLASHTTLGFLSDNASQGAGNSLVSQGMQNANVALLGQYMAATFAPAGANNGGTMALAEPAQPSDQSLLTTPHHA